MTASPVSPDPLYYEKLGGNFDRFMSDYDVYRRAELIVNGLIKPLNIPRAASVLEVGCGTGRVTEYLRPLTDDLTVNDISEKLARATAERWGCRVQPGDCRHLPDTARRYDLIVSSECVEHTPDPYGALGAMGCLLKKGGWLIVTTPNAIWYPVLVAARVLRVRRYRGIENWTWPSRTRAWLIRNGFEAVRFSGCHLLPWQVPLVKTVLPAADKLGPWLYPLMINYAFAARK